MPLRDLERMSGEIAGWRTKLPERSRYGVTQALRQTLEAAVRWGYLNRSPAKLAGRNPQPPPGPVRAFTNGEVEAIAAELQPAYRSLPTFAAATRLRPEELQALERRDIDRQAGIVSVRRTVSSREVVELAKTLWHLGHLTAESSRERRGTSSRQCRIWDTWSHAYIDPRAGGDPRLQQEHAPP